MENFNDEEKIDFPKHRFKKFIKDVVFGTIERNEILTEELDKNLGMEFKLKNLDRLFQVILKLQHMKFYINQTFPLKL